MANSSDTMESKVSNICARLQLDEEEEGGLIVAGEEIGDLGISKLILDSALWDAFSRTKW